jgi:hypothetical protein
MLSVCVPGQHATGYVLQRRRTRVLSSVCVCTVRGVLCAYRRNVINSNLLHGTERFWRFIHEIVPLALARQRLTRSSELENRATSERKC